MAISAFLKGFALRRGQLPMSLSSAAYESVFRNVNTSWNSSLLDKTFTSLGSQTFCSKPEHSDPVTQNRTKKLPETNLTKVVFKYEFANDKSREASRPFEPLVRKVLEFPGGHTFFEYRRKRDDVDCYYNLSDFCYSGFMGFREAAESNLGKKVSTFCLLYPSLFKEHIRSIMDSVVDALDVDCMIDHIEDPILIRKNPGTGCGLIWNLDEIFAIRIWEKITKGDKRVPDTILSELKRNGFDFTEVQWHVRKLRKLLRGQ